MVRNGSITHLFNGAGLNGYNRGNRFNMVTEICQHGPAVAGVCPTRHRADGADVHGSGW